MSNPAHSIYIGDKVERAVEIIGQESDKYNVWELRSKHTEDELDLNIELRGNYLRVEVADE
jgi:hypothetical protein